MPLACLVPLRATRMLRCAALRPLGLPRPRPTTPTHRTLNSLAPCAPPAPGQWCGPLTRQFGHRATAPLKVLIDQGIHHPLLYFPSFFAIKAAVAGKPLSTAVDKYRAEAWDSLKALWMVWVPAQVCGAGWCGAGRGGVGWPPRTGKPLDYTPRAPPLPTPHPTPHRPTPAAYLPAVC